MRVHTHTHPTAIDPGPYQRKQTKSPPPSCLERPKFILFQLLPEDEFSKPESGPVILLLGHSLTDLGTPSTTGGTENKAAWTVTQVLETPGPWAKLIDANDSAT